MNDDDPLVEYVISSSARTAVLRSVVDGTASTGGVLDRVPASESAVYGALAELRDRELLRKSDGDEWTVTGLGAVVAELVAEQRDTESVLRTDPEYWKRHDATALPKRFRRTLSALADADVVRATETDPNRVVREVKRRIEATDSADIVAPVYHDEYVAALRAGGSDDGDAGDCEAVPRNGDDPSRLVLAAAVVDQMVDEAEEAAETEYESLDVRVRPVSFALTVTDDCVLLSLPRLDGSYDSRTEIVVEAEAAMEWGRRLFEHCWTTATDPAEYLGSETPR